MGPIFTAPSTRNRDRRPKRFRIRQLLRFAVLATLFALPLYLLSALALKHWLNAKSSTLESVIHGLGEPLTPRELNDYYPAVPDAENGAIAYMKAAEELSQFRNQNGYDMEGLELKVLFRDNEWTEETLERLAKYIEERRVVFAALDEALAYERFRYPVDLGKLKWTNRPAFTSIGYLKDQLWLRGLNALYAEDWETLAQTQRNLLHLAESMASMPDVTAQLMYREVVRSANALLFRTIRQQNAPASLYASADPLLGKVDFSRSLRMITLPQRVEHSAKVNAFYKNDASPFRERDLKLFEDYKQIRHLPGFQALGAWERRYGMQFYTAILEDEEVPWHKRFTNAMEREPYSQRLHRRSTSFGELPPGVVPLNALESFIYWLNPYDLAWYEPVDWTSEWVEAEMRLRLLRIAIRVDARRAESGALPESLEKLTWPIPEAIADDPFHGEPIRYRKMEDGFRLYGVGKNLKDDGGYWGLDYVAEFTREERIPAPTAPPALQHGRPGR